MKNAVNIHHLSKKFGDQVVLNNVSLELPEGHIYGLVGRNGSGKSVLLKCIAGLIRPTGGTIRFRSVYRNCHRPTWAVVTQKRQGKHASFICIAP